MDRSAACTLRTRGVIAAMLRSIAVSRITLLIVACSLATSVALALVMPIQNGQAAAQSRVGGWFLFGANMPWLNWNADFGGGPNGGGVSGNRAEVAGKLQA